MEKLPHHPYIPVPAPKTPQPLRAHKVHSSRWADAQRGQILSRSRPTLVNEFKVRVDWRREAR